MPITTTIIPIFCVIAIGWLFHRRGFIPQAFLEPANRLLFYLAIPAMIFRAIANSGFQQWFHPMLLFIVLAAVAGGYAGAWIFCRVTGVSARQAGSFIQSAGHGNLGYIGLAVVFYYLGDEGLAQASVVAGFLMILQNALSILALQAHASNLQRRRRFLQLTGRVFAHPIILAAVAGIAVAVSGWHLPVILDRSLDIVRSMALPLALLLIGASLAFASILHNLKLGLVASVIKLLLMPACGWLLFRLMGFSNNELLPGLILLAAPTATVTYVMAQEMGGDVDLSVAAISASTLFSALSFSFWLAVTRI